MPSRSASEALTRVLNEAAVRGELTRTEVAWALKLVTEPGRQPVPRSDGTNRREAIVDAAAEIFHRKGYRGTTLDDIAAEVDLTKATMYHYFSSKAEILDAICDLAMSAGEQAIYSGVEGPGDAAERLRSALLEYVMALTQQRALSVLISSFDELTPKSRPQFDKRRRAMTQAVVKTIEEGIRTGTLTAADPHLASLAVFGALNWIYSWYMPDGKLEPEQVADLLVTHVMNGLLPREPATQDPRPLARTGRG